MSGVHGETLNLKAQISASRVKSLPCGSNQSLKAEIPAQNLKSHHQTSNPSLEALSVEGPGGDKRKISACLGPLGRPKN